MEPRNKVALRVALTVVEEFSKPSTNNSTQAQMPFGSSWATDNRGLVNPPIPHLFLVLEGAVCFFLLVTMKQGPERMSKIRLGH